MGFRCDLFGHSWLKSDISNVVNFDPGKNVIKLCRYRCTKCDKIKYEWESDKIYLGDVIIHWEKVK